MFVEYSCAACGTPCGEFEFMADPCKRCGCSEKRTGAAGGFKMPAESSERYQQWFHSEPVQAKLKSGEYTIMSKSDNCNHW